MSDKLASSIQAVVGLLIAGICGLIGFFLLMAGLSGWPNKSDTFPSLCAGAVFLLACAYGIYICYKSFKEFNNPTEERFINHGKTEPHSTSKWLLFALCIPIFIFTGYKSLWLFWITLNHGFMGFKTIFGILFLLIFTWSARTLWQLFLNTSAGIKFRKSED